MCVCVRVCVCVKGGVDDREVDKLLHERNLQCSLCALSLLVISRTMPPAPCQCLPRVCVCLCVYCFKVRVSHASASITGFSVALCLGRPSSRLSSLTAVTHTHTRTYTCTHTHKYTDNLSLASFPSLSPPAHHFVADNSLSRQPFPLPQCVTS